MNLKFMKIMFFIFLIQGSVKNSLSYYDNRYLADEG